MAHAFLEIGLSHFDVLKEYVNKNPISEEDQQLMIERFINERMT